MQVFKYICADDQDEANVLATLWAEKVNMKLVKVDSNLALDQDVKAYTFPEQILNLPKNILEDEFNRRKYPDSLRAPGQYIALPT